MTNEELENAKKDKITQIEYATNSAVLKEIFEESGFEFTKNSDDEIDVEIKNNKIQIQKNQKNESNVDIEMNIENCFCFSLKNWNMKKGVDELRIIAKSLFESQNSFLTTSFGSARFNLMKQIEEKITKQKLQEIDFTILPININPTYLKDSKKLSDLSKEEISNLKIKMIKVEGARFKMGDETSNRKIYVDNFFLSKTPITQKQFLSIMGDDLSHFYGENRPVDFCTWYEAIIFCNRLSELHKITPFYSVEEKYFAKDLIELLKKYGKVDFCDKVRIIPDSNGFRLPTQSEFEFASKGGINHDEYKYSGSDNLNEVAWNCSNSSNALNEVALNEVALQEVALQEVAKLKPNSLGLYDLAGNIQEWCWDWFEDFKNHSSLRIVKSGSYASSNENDFLTTSYKHRLPTLNLMFDIGFRIAQSDSETW